MEKPLPFVLENNGELILNENILSIIEKSNNPRLLLFYGATRQGKSTTLNQLIRGNIDTWKYINTSPFLSQTSQKSLTMGCDIFGPIKCSELKKRHNLTVNLKEDYDIFFCDTEGLFSLNGQTRALIPGILTLLQVCTLSVIMINTVPNQNTVSQISSEIQFSKILQQINKDLQSPLVSIYISGFQVDLIKYDDFDSALEEYQFERDQCSDLIEKNINEKYPHLNITKRDFKVIPGGPYEHNYAKEPERDNLKARLYWHSINAIAKEFMIYANKTPSHNATKLISLIKVVFNIFKGFTDLPENPDLKNVLIKYITDSFIEYSNQQFKIINEEIKKDLKNNYSEYYKMLIDDNSAQAKLNLCIEENKLEIYKTLIPDKIKNFMEKATLQLRNAIENQFEKEFSIKCEEIISNEYIMNHIHNIIEEINKAYFQEDINMDIVKNYIEIWKTIEKENENLFIYFKTKKPKSIEILKNNFNDSIEKIINNLISKKIVWKTFFEEKKKDIQKEINNQYLELFRNIQYQEEFDKLIKPHDKLSKELIEKYNEKYFKKLPNDKKSEIIGWIKQICETEYNKLKKDNLKKPKWENIYKNTKKRIKEIINHYIENIFNGKYFRNEIDPNLGRSDIIFNTIPKEISQNQEIPSDKQQEINNLINSEINLAVQLFNQKREALPLLENVLVNKEQLCNQIADEKIKELLSQFYYAEDKINYNADNFYTLLKQNDKINLKIPQNNIEFNNMINKVSKNKSHEYNNILVPQKPKWNTIKNNIIVKINDICEKFLKKVMENKSYKEDVKYDTSSLESKINSLNIFNEIKENKHKEIKDLINKKKEETKQKILNEANSLSNWSDIKNLKIKEGYEIMIHKADTNLGTKDLNTIIDILVKEVINYPSFCDSLKNKTHFNEVYNELQKKAKEIGNNYIIKKNNEEKQKQEAEKKLKELNEKIEREKQERLRIEKETRERIEKSEREAREAREREKQAKLKAEQERQARERIEKERQRQIELERERQRQRQIEIERERERQRIEEERRRQQCFPSTPYRGNSIVDGLKAIGANSSYNYRCAIAARNGIGGYAGRPHENLHMLNLLIQGRLLRP